MIHLRKYIRNLILEDCRKVNDKIYSGIEAIDFKGFLIEVLRADSDAIHIQLTRSAGGGQTFEAGFIKLAKVIYEDDTPDEAIAYRKKYNPDLITCNDSYIVNYSSILRLYRDRLKGEGVGAVLYDVALELAGKNGISPDRYSITEDSFRMYDYFYKNPDKYERKYLDNMGETEPTEDDCPAESPYDYKFYDTTETLSLSGSPLGYTYIKKDTSQPTIKCLEQRGLISGKFNFQA